MADGRDLRAAPRDNVNLDDAERLGALARPEASARTIELLRVEARSSSRFWPQLKGSESKLGGGEPATFLADRLELLATTFATIWEQFCWNYFPLPRVPTVPIDLRDGFTEFWLARVRRSLAIPYVLIVAVPVFAMGLTGMLVLTSPAIAASVSQTLLAYSWDFQAALAYLLLGGSLFVLVAVPHVPAFGPPSIQALSATARRKGRPLSTASVAFVLCFLISAFEAKKKSV